MNRQLLGFLIFNGFLFYVISGYPVNYDDGGHPVFTGFLILLVYMGLIAWILGHKTSFYIAKGLFKIQKLSLFHLDFNLSVIPNDNFFIISRKRNKFWAFLTIVTISFFLSSFITSELVDLFDPVIENDLHEVTFGDQSTKIIPSSFLILGIAPFLYAIYIIDFSNLRVEIPGKKIISSVSSVFRILFSSLAIYYTVSNVHTIWILSIPDDLTLPLAIGGYVLLMIFLLSSHISLSFLFLHFSEEKLTKKFQLYLNSLGITEKEYHIK